MLAADEPWRSDVAIAYGYADRAWVRATLLPRLERWGIGYAIDFFDNVPGRSLRSETTRLLRSTRVALVVLSRAWLASPLCSYQRDLMRRLAATGALAVVILRRDASPLPDVANAHAIEGESWLALQTALMSHVAPMQSHPLAASLALTKKPSTEGYRGLAYEADVQVENRTEAPFTFASLRIAFRIHGEASMLARSIESMLISESEEQRLVEFVRRGRSAKIDEPERVVDGFEIPPHTRMTMRHIELSDAPVTIPSKTIVDVEISAEVSKTRVSEICYGVLPPLLRLPAADSERRYELALPRGGVLPATSGILDDDIVAQAFATARARGRDALLQRVQPRFVTVYGSATMRLHFASGWHFVFSDPRRGELLDVDAADPSWLQPPRRGAAAASSPISEDLLARCIIDGRSAYLIARAVATADGSDDAVHLTCESVDGDAAPLWTAPFALDGARVGVRADNGTLAVESPDGWHRAPAARAGIYG